MRMSDFTALGRLPDPRYPTNRAIMALALAVGAAGAIFQWLRGTALLDGVNWGFGAGFAMFLAWALGRELDPDHDLSAFVAAGLALVAVLLVEAPSLMVILWLLLVLRLVNRTVGLPAKPLDSLGVLGFGAWLTWQGDWIVGLVTSGAFLLDGLLSPPLRTHLFISGLALVATVVLTIFQGVMASGSGPTTAVAISSLAMAGLFLVVIATSRELRAVGDATGEPLHPRRVQAAQILALATALLFAWRAGATGVQAMLPLWAAMLGVSLYRLAILFLSRKRQLLTGG
jgi:hypothetical protein